MARVKIEYIPNDTFASANEQDFAEIDFELYAEEESTTATATAHTSAESFLIAVEQSRILTAEGERFLFKRLNFLKFRADALLATTRGGRKSRKIAAEVERLLKDAAETRDQIACANLRLVKSIVRKLSNSQDQFEDFFAEANAILLNAIDKFDYARGYRFSTYATHAVQRHTFRLIESNKRRRERETTDAVCDLSQFAGQSCQSETDGKKIHDAVDAILASFDSILDGREQQIVRARFGLDGSEKGKSMRAIGDDLGLSKERVRQLLHGSIEKLAEFNKPLESVFEG